MTQPNPSSNTTKLCAYCQNMIERGYTQSQTAIAHEQQTHTLPGHIEASKDLITFGDNPTPADFIESIAVGEASKPEFDKPPSQRFGEPVELDPSKEVHSLEEIRDLARTSKSDRVIDEVSQFSEEDIDKITLPPQVKGKLEYHGTQSAGTDDVIEPLDRNQVAAKTVGIPARGTMLLADKINEIVAYINDHNNPKEVKDE